MTYTNLLLLLFPDEVENYYRKVQDHFGNEQSEGHTQ